MGVHRSNTVSATVGLVSLSPSFNFSLLDRARDFGRKLRSRPEARATFFSVSAFGFSQILRIASSLIMTRVLAPEMFGIMALVLAIQIMMALISDFGIRQIVIQSPRGNEPELLNTAWTIEILRSVAVWLICLAISVGLFAADQLGLLSPGSTWGAPDLPMVLAALTLTTVIHGFRSTKLMTAVRRMQLGKPSVIEVVSQISGLAVMIGYGLAYATIWALVVGAVASALVTVILSHTWLKGPTNRFCWDRSAISELYITGRWMMLSSIIQAFSTNIDRFLLAGVVSPVFLGLYSLALNLVLLVEILGGKLITDVAFPSLCEAAREDREGFSTHVFKARLPIDLGYLIASGLMFAAATSLVDLLYDDRYLEAGSILQILSLSLFFARYGIYPFAYLALGEAHLLAAVNFIRIIFSVILILGCYFAFGSYGAIFAIAMSGLSVMLSVFWLNRRFGLNNFAYELVVLPAWVVGYGLGLIAAKFIGYLLG